MFLLHYQIGILTGVFLRIWRQAMKILGITCSPRKNGNTEILMKQVLEAAGMEGCETEIFRMSEHEVAPCDACQTCFETGECIIKDDMQQLYAMLESADGIILGTPVYFGSVSAQGKAVMDRMFSLLQRRALKDKIAGALVVTRRVGAIQTRSLIYSFCIAQGMIVAGGAIGYGREIGDVLTGVGGGIDMSAMEESRILGVNVARLTRIFHKGS
jgi:multimeric flavodoxin WrbA